MTWSDTFLGILKDNDVRLISYVPDNVLTPLIRGRRRRQLFPVGRRDPRGRSGRRRRPALTWRGCAAAVMMQTSGFALIANALASLVVPYQIPAIMVISERGTHGRVQYRPVAGRAHHAADARSARHRRTTR